MANRLKEDEKNERIIRGLLKLNENRRCINCNSLGPQYVCTNFWTFICTTCSGIHREFTHRVKSVSMAKFTSQEVRALQEGGNKCAKEIYFKEWDSQRHSLPDSSNVDRLRDFIKHVYVDRRYSGEKNYEKPSRGKMGDKEDSQGGSGSPPYGDSYEWRRSEISSPGGRSDDKNSRYTYDERRSPGYDQESRQYGDNRKSPVRPEIVNDWRREDRFGNGRRFEDRGKSDGDLKLDGRSPEGPKDLDTSSPPMVRPVRDILGDNVIPLRISGPPKTNNGRIADGSVHTQRTASSSSLGSANEHPVEVKWESSGSLIDFDADPEPSFGATVSEAQQTTMPQSFAQPPSSTNDNNWASFDFSPESKVSQSPNVNVLDSAISELSVPASVPNHMSVIPGGAGAVAARSTGNATAVPLGYAPMFPYNVTAPAAASVSSLSTIPHVGVAAHGLTSIFPVSGGNSSFTVTGVGQWPNMQHQQPNMQHQQPYQQYTPVHGASSMQPWNLAPNAQRPPSSSAVPIPQSVSQPAVEVTSGVLSQPSHAEEKFSGRKELPQDLFTVNYSPVPVPIQRWQSGPLHGMGFNMQHNTGLPMPTYPQLSKSANPFDLGDEPPPVQAPTFPSMSSLQGALPNMPPSSGILRTSSLGAPSATWMPPESSPYPSAMPPHPPSYASAMPPRPYMGQPVPNNMPPSRHQGFGSDGVAFRSFNPDQQLAGRYSAPATPNPYSSVGGNPFG